MIPSLAPAHSDGSVRKLSNGSSRLLFEYVRDSNLSRNGEKQGTTSECVDSTEVGAAASSTLLDEADERTVRSSCRVPLEPKHSRKTVFRRDCFEGRVPRGIESRREDDECSSIESRDSAKRRVSLDAVFRWDERSLTRALFSRLDESDEGDFYIDVVLICDFELDWITFSEIRRYSMLDIDG